MLDCPRRRCLKGERPDCGTLVFNYGRHEVANFLISGDFSQLGEWNHDASWEAVRRPVEEALSAVPHRAWRLCEMRKG